MKIKNIVFSGVMGAILATAANAAPTIASKAYVDTKIGAVETAYQAADTTTLNSATGYTDQQVGTLSQLTTTAQGNTVAAINEVNAAYKDADSTLDGRVTGLETKVGEGTMTVSGAAQTDVIAAINALDTKTEDIASSENLKNLENTVKTHTTQITDLQTADTTNLQEAKNYADSLADNYDAAGAAATAETNAKAYADGLAGNYDAKGSAATAEAAAKSYADEKLALKVNIAQGEGAANHVVITDSTGNVTTSATIEQTQVNGLSDALAAKLPVTAANNADGKYVLTATALNGTITYAWEDISRDVTE